MPKFRKKPIVIEAVQFDGTKNNLAEISRLSYNIGVYAPCVLAIKTLEGNMTASIGDWIIKGIQGEVYPCKDDIFRATYEPVEEADGYD